MNHSALMVRIYLQESESATDTIIDYLHDEAKVKGVTVFRGIAGFGKSGVMHTTKLTDLSLNLPIIIEFFDDAVKVDQVLVYLKKIVEPDHIVSWPVSLSQK